jgi:hypothetical protein
LLALNRKEWIANSKTNILKKQLRTPNFQTLNT